MAALIGTGLMALTALVRIGIREFWSSISRKPPKLKVIEGLPVGLLLGCTVLMVVYAGDVMRFTQRAANNLHSPGNYMRSVLDKDPLPSPSAASSHLPAAPDALPGSISTPDAPTSGGSAP